MILNEYICTEIKEWNDEKKEYVRTYINKKPYKGETNEELTHELCEFAKNVDRYDGGIQYILTLGKYTETGKYCYSRFIYAI